MKMEDITGKNIKISAATITVLNDDNGKLAGLVRNLETYFNLNASRSRGYAELSPLWKASRHFDADRQTKFLSRMFKDNFKWYYIINEAEIASIEKWLEEYPDATTRGIVNPKTVEFLETQEQVAQNFGAIIIRVASIKDTRKEVN